MQPTKPSLKDTPSSSAPLFQSRTEPLVRDPKTLIDLLYEGFYMLLLLHNNHAPSDASSLRVSVKSLLDSFEVGAKRLNIESELIFETKFAFCATVDEIILRSKFAIRREWESQPLQLSLFGEQLAGETFFIKLEKLRHQGASALPALEVFYQCLLLGFQGKYILEGPEKLNYFISRLGDEIVHLKGKRNAFAPRALPPDQIKNALRNEVPTWMLAAVFSLFAMLGYTGFKTTLSHQTKKAVSQYQELIQLSPKNSNITINLP
jgi:type VI secretion system protein ImpK